MFDNKWQKKEMPLVSLIGMGGGIASPAFLASIVLNILKPTVFSPADDTGLPDFDYTAESSAITNVDIGTGPGIGDTEVFETGGVAFTSSAYDSTNNRVVITYQDFGNSDKGTVVVGQISGTGITFGTPVIFDSSAVYNTAVTFDSTNNKVIISYTKNSLGYAIVGEVSGTSINFPSPPSSAFDGQGGGLDNNSIVYDSTHNRVVIVYRDAGNYSYGTAVVGTVSGTSITFGTPVIFANAATYHTAATFDSTNGKVVIAYADSGNSNYGTAIVGEVSDTGNTISFNGSEAVFASTSTNAPRSIVYDSTNNRIVAAYQDGWASDHGKAVVGTINGDNITFSNSPTTFASNGKTDHISATFDSTNGKVVIAYQDQGNSSYGTVIAGEVNPNTNAITFGSPAVFESADTQRITATYNSTDDKVVIAYMDVGNSYYGTATVFGNTGFPDPSAPATLTLTDTTVSKVSDGSLVEGVSIDEVLTVGETVQADTAITSTVTVPVFSATTYTGNGSTMSISTGIDLTTKGLLWFKGTGGSGHRNDMHGHFLFDSERGNYGYYLKSPEADANGDFASYGWAPQPAADGTISNLKANLIHNNIDWVSWAFRAAPGFFDVVSWSGNSVNGRQISHDLGSVPGMILIKNLTNTSNWEVWHNSFDSDDYMGLNSTSSKYETSGPWNNTLPTSEHFTVSSDMDVNRTGDNYVAYLFADDTPGLIKCGTYTGTGSSQTIDTGFKPKFVLTKSRSHSSDWYLMDSENPGQASYANWAGPAQNVPIGYVNNGFTVDGVNSALNASGYEYIYLAIAENAETDITTQSTASGTVSASSGNTITLSNTTGTWSTGMKVQGTDSDTKDNPDPILAENVSLTSSAPTAERNVNTWGDAIWEIATDENFTQNVQTATTALSATGIQAGPSFTLEPDTGYYTRTKYTALGQESEWSDVTYFVTGSLPVYADDVFSTYLYQGNGSTQTITNGIDLAGEGGMVWIKRRSSTASHVLNDTVRGAGKQIRPDLTDAEVTNTNNFAAFTSDGFTVGAGSGSNASSEAHVAWTFRKAPGFFDIVTWTGNATAGRNISHNLGSVPGMILIKELEGGDWAVYHRSLGAGKSLTLNSSTGKESSTEIFGNTTPTSTHFTVGNHGRTNDNNRTYVAYLFAHDDQSFGTNGDESIIKCGSYTGNDSTDGPEIDLGFELQFLLLKRADNSDDWFMVDNMRGLPKLQAVYPNKSNAETDWGDTYMTFTSTGFKLHTQNSMFNNAEKYIYMAIRRPHKPPTSATEVFAVDTRGGTSPTPPTFYSGFPVDLVIRRDTYLSEWTTRTRLLGESRLLKLNANDAEASGTQSAVEFDQNNGVGSNTGVDSNNYAWMFKRAPGFFDVVAYTGTGANRTVNHNLGAVPELVIVKNRDLDRNWVIWSSYLPAADNFLIFTNSSVLTDSSVFQTTNTFTSTQFGIGTNNSSNRSGDDYIGYLFASLDGISKVGSYTGTGSNVNVDCGFTAGARFVLIKRTDAGNSTTHWYVWDTERGIVSGNDPYLLLNSTDAEVTNTDYIDPLNAGFTVTSSAPAALNASGGTYLFLAIA